MVASTGQLGETVSHWSVESDISGEEAADVNRLSIDRLRFGVAIALS